MAACKYFAVELLATKMLGGANETVGKLWAGKASAVVVNGCAVTAWLAS